MKKLILGALASALIASCAVSAYAAGNTETISYTYDAGRWTTHHREMEKLGRGLVAIKSGNGVYLSWRLLDSEDNRFGSAEKNVSFNVYRNGTKIDEVTDSTNYSDTTAGTSYSVAPVINGIEGEKCAEVKVQGNSYFDIPITKPETETIYTPDGEVSGTYSFFPADCSAGDLDGDGEYEIIIKWTSAEKDVGSPGSPVYSGTVRFSAYELDGTKMWDKEINLGKNVYSSAHTAQFLVYDFDGDGKAEMTVQTSLGSTDAKGNYVSHAADPVNSADIYALTDTENEETDYRADGDGRIREGKEFLTVFNGETGEAIDTIDLPTARIPGNKGKEFGDDFGNRCNRFMSSVAYLDGERPYAVYSRGYYFGRNGNQRTSIAGISFDGKRLNAKYRFDTQKGQPGYYDGAYDFVGNGNHNCTVADVDDDGKDEYMTGALCMEVTDDDEFKPRWCTHQEHGDALHIGDYDPTHEGFEFFIIHEDGNKENAEGGYGYTNSQGQWCDFGMSVVDAYDGTILFHHNASDDTGRGMMANVGSGGYYQINSSNAGNYQCNGGTDFSEIRNGMSVNFRVFWDGDLFDELLDGVNITSWNGSGMGRIFSATGCTRINGTKANPSLQADLFGDWREEVIYPTNDGNYLRVFSTTTPTEYKIKTLMHDPVYRSGVAAEQTAYNQPPHVGLYLAEEVFDAPTESIEIISLPSKTSYALGEQLDTTGLRVKATLSDGTEKEVASFSVSGYDPEKPGTQTLTVTYTDKTAQFDVIVKTVTGISVTPPSKTIYYEGQPLDTTDMVVTAIYEDNSRSVVTNGYYVYGYDPYTLGDQTVTVVYADQSAAFKVRVKEGTIAAINGTYVTDSTAASLASEVSIGQYKNDFTIEHTVTINSLPANGSNDRNSTNGFFMRFNPPDGTGAGWYIGSGRWGGTTIVWKSTSATTVASNIQVGETYTFKYDFKNIGTGERGAAYVNLTVTDSKGDVVGSAENLNLRNLTNDNQSSSPVGVVQIYNQANANSAASVTIADAKAYSDSKIVSVSGNQITVNMASTSQTNVFAAKYDADGVLTELEKLDVEQTGESTVTASFIPHKVFIWTDDIYPLDAWDNPDKSYDEPEPELYTLTVTVTDPSEAPVEGAEVLLMNRKSSGGGSGDDEESYSLLSSTMTQTTDENGTAVFTGVENSIYLLRAVYSELQSETKIIRVKGNSEETIQFQDLIN